jgi:hypothetical protein
VRIKSNRRSQIHSDSEIYRPRKHENVDFP